MKVLFAATELAPLIRVGGLAEAAGGLVAMLRRLAVDVDVVLPDYGGIELADESVTQLELPKWAGEMWARQGVHAGIGPVTLLGSAQLRKPHPYVDSTGAGWEDNDVRFFQFAAAVAAHRDITDPDVVHLNDYHTAPAVALGEASAPTVLTIHTLGYQGVTAAKWMKRIVRRPEDFAWYGGTNPLAGGILQADRIVAVSPNYAKEIVHEDSGMGMHELLASRGGDLVGILNGIDTTEWDPATDTATAATFTTADKSGREACRRQLQEIAGWSGREAIIGVVSRLVDQKGIDMIVGATRYLARLPGRLFVLGSGLEGFATSLRRAANADPDRVYFHEGYDLELAHQIFAGADIYAMPSRFEPCGLAQMQAMRYGAVPVVTPVGGLVDTVKDSDSSRRGTGFTAMDVSEAGFVDALHRAVRARKNAKRWSGIQDRGMQHDWSWESPAAQHLELYRQLAG